jgi:hypothetical protein
MPNLCHKAKVFREVSDMGRDFETELDDVVRLRNDVDHVKDVVHRDADLKGFVARLEMAEAWLNAIKGVEVQEN